MSNLVLNKQEYKEILSILDTTIGYIDKIGSGFYGKEVVISLTIACFNIFISKL